MTSRMGGHRAPGRATPFRGSGLLPVMATLLLLAVAISSAAPVEAPRDSRAASAQQSRTASASGPAPLRGVNLYDFPWYDGYNATWVGEPQSAFDFLAERGVQVVRLPFSWSVLQPELGGELDQAYLDKIVDQVEKASNAGIRTVLDLHSACHYSTGGRPGEGPELACGKGISTEQFGNVWVRLSQVFRGDPGVYAYDLTNEPRQITAQTWERFSQAAATALRADGDNTLLWIEGAKYSQTHNWTEVHPDPWIDDPAGNITYSAHQYLGDSRYPRGYDYDQYPEYTARALDDLRSFLGWLDEFDVRGNIGEVGWPSSDRTDTWKQWNALGDRWYDLADTAGLTVTYFSATSVYDEANVVYDAPTNADGCTTDPGDTRPHCVPPGISEAESQAEIIEQHLNF